MENDKVILDASKKTLTAPSQYTGMLGVIIVVVLFLGYLLHSDVKTTRALSDAKEYHNGVAKMRIDQCHDIQKQAVAALDRQSSAHVAHALVLGELSVTVEDLSTQVGKNREAFERYVNVVEDRLFRQGKEK